MNSTPASEPNNRSWIRIGTCDGALLGVLICAGWILHDAAVFLRSGSPATFLLLLPGCLVAAAIGALVGACLRSFVVFAGVLLLAIVGSGTPFVFDVALSRAEIWVPRAALLLTCAWVAAAWLGQRGGRGRASFGLAFGILACAAQTISRSGTSYLQTPLVVAAVVLLITGLPRPIRSAALGRLAATLALLVPGIWYALDAAPRAHSPRADLTPPPNTAATTRPNLVLIVLDTLRADRLAPYGYERETTPQLDVFVRESATRYTRSYSTSPWTLPSHASLFTGLLPGEHGATNPRIVDKTTLRIAVRPAQPLRQDLTTIAERLRNDGYQSAAIVANCAYLDHRFGMDQGFEHYDDRRDTYVGWYMALAQFGGNALEVGHLTYRDAREITDLALDWLDDRRKDSAFFLMLNYMEAHEPYLTSEKYANAFEPDTRPMDPMKSERSEWPLEHDRALLELDEHLGRLLDELKARDLFENSVVVVTSDHGQALGDHGRDGHAWTLYDSTVRVPLYVKPAGGRSTESNDTPIDGTGTHDLMIELLGMTLESRDVEAEFQGWVSELYSGKTNPGIEAWAAAVGRDLSADLVAWQEGTIKYIVASDGSVEAFDIERDPRELSPLELPEADLVRVRERGAAWWAAHPPPKPLDVEMSDELLEQMENLGY